MNEEQTLFDAPVLPISALSGKPVARARNTDPKSSHDAAKRVNVTGMKAGVMFALDAIGSGTEEQVRHKMMDLGFDPKPSTPRSRLAELRKAGYVYIVRHADNQAVYAVTDRGRTFINDLRQAQGEIAA